MYYIYGTNQPENQPYTILQPDAYYFHELANAIFTCEKLIEDCADMDYMRIVNCVFPPDELGEMETEQLSVAFWHLGKVKFIKI